MTHEATPHIKQRKMQSNKTKIKDLQDLLQGIPAGHFCKDSSNGNPQILPETLNFRTLAIWIRWSMNLGTRKFGVLEV